MTSIHPKPLLANTLASETVCVGIAQIAPVWLDRAQTIEKILHSMHEAASLGVEVLAFGEAILPGYPFWIDATDGARFESPLQKELFAHYAQEAVCIERGDLSAILDKAKELQMMVILGCVERPTGRGGHSLYCSLVTISSLGEILSIHRKLMPTFEERLVWSIGDGHGLKTHPYKSFTFGSLNCWENWLPLVRSALYGQGEDVHIAVWPGSERNTRDITRFLALEARSYILSASGLLRLEDIPTHIPHSSLLRDVFAETPLIADGGSCIAAPDGSWLVEPCTGEERCLVATLDHAFIRRERHNLDLAGHYSRPDVVQLTLNSVRQTTLRILE